MIIREGSPRQTDRQMNRRDATLNVSVMGQGIHRTYMITTQMKTRALRERKLHQGQNVPKVIRDSNTDFRINPDADRDVCRTAPKMLWMHCLVGVSHFAKFRKNRRMTVRETVRNLLKSAIPQW